MAAPLRSDSPTPAPDWSRPGHQKFTRKRKKSGAAGHSKGGGQAAYAAQQTLGIHKVITINSARPPFVDHPNRRVAQTNVIVVQRRALRCPTLPPSGSPRPAGDSPDGRVQWSAPSLSRCPVSIPPASGQVTGCPRTARVFRPRWRALLPRGSLDLARCNRPHRSCRQIAGSALQKERAPSRVPPKRPPKRKTRPSRLERRRRGLLPWL